MAIKLKDSRNAGIIAAVIILGLCSLVMLFRYGEISDFLKTIQSEDSRRAETIDSMSYDLNEGVYILYNELSEETDPAEVLEMYGQQQFNLTRRYMDYEIFDAEGNAQLNAASETVAERLKAASESYYAFRAKYTFSEDGELSGIQIDGTVLDPQEEYELESQYLNVASEVGYNYEISSIAEPAGVTIVYGMTEKNLDTYGETIGSGIYNYSFVNTTYYRDTLECLLLFVIAAALLLPFAKRLDISGRKIFTVPFEIPLAVLIVIIFGTNIQYLPADLVYTTITGNYPAAGHGGEIIIWTLNFLMWFLIFGIIFWAVTCFRAVIRMKTAYFKERTLTAKLIRRFAGDESGVKSAAKKTLRKGKAFVARQYDNLLHIDFQDKTNRTILKIVIINYIILALVCFLWYYGTLALIIYSVLLFLFLRKYTKDLQEKYKLLLKSTNQLAEGHLDVPIEGDIGLFNPIQDELKKIQKGFKKAVDEEVKNERMKTELVTNVSHDLRTPLTAIITYTDLLKNEKDAEKRKEYIDVLERKSLRLKVLIEDLFEISKAASKSVVMHFMKVDIVDLLKQVGLENDSKIRESHLEFRWKLPDHKLVMWLDSQKTYRIFENLIVNITKYAMPHTRVYIELTEEENNVYISMKNVSASQLNFNADEITDRFVRGDSSRNTEGSGLGLAIAKSFAELQHGTLKISTEADLFKADIMLPKLEIPPEETQMADARSEADGSGAAS